MSGLQGLRVVVTRSASRADGLADALTAAGAVPILFPAIETRPPESLAALDAALRRASQYDWLVFTSATGVHAALDRASRLGLIAARPAGGARVWARDCRVAAVGPATAAALADRGFDDVVLPEEFTGDAIPAAVGSVRGLRFLLLRADRARRDLPERLEALGGRVDDVTAYRTLPLQSQVTGPAADAVRAGVDAVTFTSPSTVEGFVSGLGSDWRDVVGDALIATIGPVTSEAARSAGLRVDAEADPHTIDGLIHALARKLETRGKERSA